MLRYTFPHEVTWKKRFQGYRVEGDRSPSRKGGERDSSERGGTGYRGYSVLAGRNGIGSERRERGRDKVQGVQTTKSQGTKGKARERTERGADMVRGGEFKAPNRQPHPGAKSQGRKGKGRERI